MTLHSIRNVSGEDLTYFDAGKEREIYPITVIEPSLGADRVTLAFLCGAYDEEKLSASEDGNRRYENSSSFPSGTGTCKDWCTSFIQETG